MRQTLAASSLLAFVLVLPFPCRGAEAKPAGNSSLALEWNARLRYETVSQDGFTPPAEALSARLRLGLRADFGSNWRGLVEAEGVAAAISSYNDGANGKSGLPVILDPPGTELNQAWVGWHGQAAAVTLGRQRFQLDNQRFVGNSGWRQNEQTFDAISAQWKGQRALSVRYAWLARVHRVNGDDALDPLARQRRLGSHVLELATARGPMQFAAYLLAHDDRDVPSASTLTTGARWSGTHPGKAGVWGWRAEAARQIDYADNPGRFQHGYWVLEPSLKVGAITWRAGWEHLGGNGTHALQTPLATLHAFNGWADKFLVTPATGLDDRYAGASGTFGSVAPAKSTWVVALHDYRAASGGARIGTELDASLAFPVREKLAGLIKLANYRSSGPDGDSRKLWLQLEWTP